MPKKRGSEPAEEKSRCLLLDAGKKLFARRGFEGTTVRDLARSAGVNLSLVSYYFRGKEGLYRECLELFGQARLEMAEKLLQPVSTLPEYRERLRQAIQEIVAVQIEEPEIAQIVHREIESDLPVAAKIFEETFLKIFQAWVKFFQHGQEKGYIHEHLDPGILAQILQGSLNYFVRVDSVRMRYFKHSIKDAEHRAQLVDNFVSVFSSGCFREA